MRPTILLVEDDLVISEVLTSVLEEAGYAVTSAQDGERAIALLGEAAPDLAVLDVMMPLVDGREVLKHMRATAATQHVPVILMSASPLDVVDGARDYSVFLRKPFDLQTLLDEIARIMPQASAGNRPQEAARPSPAS